MANPRRSSYPHTVLDVSYTPPPVTASAITTSSSSSFASHVLSSIVVFLKRPHSFPFLLSVFVLLTWVSLRFQQHQPPPVSSTLSTSSSASYGGDAGVDADADADANLSRFESSDGITSDKRGWLLNPVAAAEKAGISGYAQSCASVHVGEIKPGGIRGNHRHHSCNETFIIWGAVTRYRHENPDSGEKGYAEVIIGADEVAIAASPSGTAHALINTDATRTTFFLGCQDRVPSYNSSDTDFNVWKDL